jgi:hypothetical protein
MTRHAVTTGLDAWDIPALRFGVAGLILLPIIMRRGLAFDRLARIETTPSSSAARPPWSPHHRGADCSIVKVLPTAAKKSSSTG